MRRERLTELGIQLPALPTVVLGALPGPPDWAPRLASIGLDVVASGAAADTPVTAAAARAAAPYRPFKAAASDPDAVAALAASGCPLVEAPAGTAPDAYILSRADGVVAAVDGSSETVEDLNDVARCAVRAARGLGAANVWIAATPGLDALPVAVVEAKLAVLVEGAHQARLAIAKDQFDLA